MVWTIVALAGALVAASIFMKAGTRPALHVLACIAALACGLGVEQASSARFAERALGEAREVEFRGRLLSLPEADSEGRHLLHLRGRSGDNPEMTVLLTVASGGDPEGLRTGDAVSVWCRLVRPRGYANPGGGQPAMALRGRGLHAVGSVKSMLLVRKLAEGPTGVRRIIDEAKLEARRRLDGAFEEQGPRRTIMGAMLLGDRAALDPDLSRMLRDAGLIHLVAISGLHVGVLAVAVFGLLRRSRMPQWALFAVALFLLPAFALFVGSRPPVVRAVATAALVLFGRWRGREGDALNSLAILACLLVALDPGALRAPGFQLTFLATAGILRLSAPLAALLPLPRLPAMGVAVSASAYMAAAPVVACHFGWLAPVAIPLNLAAAPLCALILASGYATVIFDGAAVLHDCSVWIAGWSVSSLLQVAALGAQLELSGWRVGSPGSAATLCYYALGAAIPASKVGRSARLGLYAMAFAAALVWLHIGPPPPRAGELRAAVLDAGQSQAVVLRGSRDTVLMVDASGGPNPRFDPGERVVLPFLSAWGIRRIDVLVISHGHLDHAAGAFAVLREIEVGELWLGPGFHRDDLQAELAAHAGRRGAAVVLAHAGVGAVRGGLRLEVLAPRPWRDTLSANDRSVVVRIGDAPHRILIPGDVETAGESALLGSGRSVRAEALVVPHHGGSGSCGAALLRTVGPDQAVVSCGLANRFGHPSPDVARRIEDAGARLWRTDRDGMVLLTAGESGWEVSAMRRSTRAAPE